MFYVVILHLHHHRHHHHHHHHHQQLSSISICLTRWLYMRLINKYRHFIRRTSQAVGKMTETFPICSLREWFVNPKRGLSIPFYKEVGMTYYKEVGMTYYKQYIPQISIKSGGWLYIWVIPKDKRFRPIILWPLSSVTYPTLGRGVWPPGWGHASENPRLPAKLKEILCCEVEETRRYHRGF